MSSMNLSGVHDAPPDTAKVVYLKVLSSGGLAKDAVLRLTARGYEHALRGRKDGCTFFGCKKREEKQGPVVNDVLLPLDDAFVAEQQRGQHFVIYYATETDAFYLRDLAVGFGVFTRVDKPLLLKENYMLNVGDSFLLVTISEEQVLKLTMYGSHTTGDAQSFAPTGECLTVGRDQACDVLINDPLISKVQASLYKTDFGWFVDDGDKRSGRSSTNGTWLYANESTELYTGMIFKANNTLFHVSVV